MDIAVVNTWLITFQGKNLGIIENGALGVENGKISYVGSMEGFNYKKADIVIDATNHVTMPGLINAHTHTALTLLRGGAQDMPEIEWMNKGLLPLAMHMTPEDFVLGSKLGVLEGLKTGTTTFAEYTVNVTDTVENLYLPLGIRIVATEMINEVGYSRAPLKPTDLYEFDHSKGENELKRANELFRKFRSQEMVSCMYGPQALDMISLDLLKTIKEQAIEQNAKIHMHVAQGERERLQITGRYGKNKSTVKVLHKNGMLGSFLLAAHCHDTDEKERELMAKEKVSMVVCPSAIAMIDGIVPPVGHYIEIGGDAGLGTDQAPGPGHHNLFQEMRTASILTKTLHRDPTALPAWKALQLATIGGAKTLGIDKKVGTLEVGKQADIITINLGYLHLTPIVAQPFKNFIPNLVHSTNGTEVDNVIINGKVIMRESKFLDIDEQTIIKEANIRAKRIFESATEDWKKANSKLVKDVQNGWL
ncbi:MAG: amidohydrolase family protein [Candidatus Jordarchaeum sp.]|uniref:amidohydrolase family protein n=1 Tax=Candidatus Jordarchaeum sp. TaxID=2823881 RepID=UPI00404B6C37